MAKVLGLPFMPWQRYVADVILEIDPATGLFAYRNWTLVVPRQSGKTTLVLAKAVHRARAWRRQRIVYTAQTRNDARKKWEDDHLPVLEASPYGRRKLYKPRLTNGNEALLWDNGSQYGIVAVTEKSGHGPTLDEAFIDEAFAQQDYRLEQAFRPAMITRSMAQLGVLSTAGRSPARSPYLWDKVEAGRQRCLEEQWGASAYFEWSADDDMDRDDPATWWATMPALGHTVTEHAVAAEHESLPAEEFDRAYLNRWGDDGLDDTVIAEADWEPLGLSEGQLDPVSLALDVSPGYGSAAIASVADAAGDPTKIAGELIRHGPGTDWVIPELIRLKEAHGPKGIGVDARGPAAALIADLDKADLGVTLLNGTDITHACGALLDDVLNGRIWHRNQPDLDVAIYGASRSRSADSWRWTRTGSQIDISPLYALTIAAHIHRQPVDDDTGGDFVDVV